MEHGENIIFSNLKNKVWHSVIMSFTKPFKGNLDDVIVFIEEEKRKIYATFQLNKEEIHEFDLSTLPDANSVLFYEIKDRKDFIKKDIEGLLTYNKWRGSWMCIENHLLALKQDDACF